MGWQNERRVRCPRCGSLDTKRHGKTSSAPTGLAGSLGSLQRFLCRSCGRTFTFPRKAARPRARFAYDAIEEAVRLYVQGLSSYRVLAVLLEQRLGRSVGRFTLNGWVDELGERAKTPVEVSAELRPSSWGGFLGVDGKAIYVAGQEHALLVGVDHPTHDVVHAVVAEIEGEEAFERLVREAVTEAGYLWGSKIAVRRGAGFSDRSIASQPARLYSESARAEERKRYVHSSAKRRESAKTTWTSG